MRRSRCVAGRLLKRESFAATSDTSFYLKVDKDLTFINQNMFKNTIDDLIAKL